MAGADPLQARHDTVKILLQLPHDNDDPSKRYALADPDELTPYAVRAYRATYYDEPDDSDELVTVSRKSMIALLAMAESYQALTMSALTQKDAVGKLRDLWRARRARKAAAR